MKPKLTDEQRAKLQRLFEAAIAGEVAEHPEPQRHEASLYIARWGDGEDELEHVGTVVTEEKP